MAGDAMYAPQLDYVFIISIIIGFIIPLINIFSGSFGDFLDFDVDADMDLDIDGADAGVFPFNVLCLCLLLIVFGVIGKVLSRWMTALWTTVSLTAAALLAGAAFYWLMYRFVVLKLKKSTVLTLSYDDLCGKSAEVTMSISGDGMGMISVLDSTGTFVSFRARRDPDLADRMGEILHKGRRVTITEVDKNEKICYVSTSPGEFEGGILK